ncbi:hypothetical protein FH587_02875 (plasmid) [Leptospira interrogans]|uniref:hypothetical protein n=1 Tax=Leptospira interrogans TaxID=173 RepID=UPI001F07EACC|nr:hypothetical protein [Leptospira interrogans]UML82843.1 hypothetical protein FH587_02875 [Leptospira interrogans]
MEILERYKIYPIGEGSDYYEVYDSLTKEVVYSHTKRAWCIDWVLEKFIQSEKSKLKTKKKDQK